MLLWYRSRINCTIFVVLFKVFDFRIFGKYRIVEMICFGIVVSFWFLTLMNFFISSFFSPIICCSCFQYLHNYKSAYLDDEFPYDFVFFYTFTVIVRCVWCIFSYFWSWYRLKSWRSCTSNQFPVLVTILASSTVTSKCMRSYLSRLKCSDEKIIGKRWHVHVCLLDESWMDL